MPVARSYNQILLFMENKYLITVIAAGIMTQHPPYYAEALWEIPLVGVRGWASSN